MTEGFGGVVGSSSTSTLRGGGVVGLESSELMTDGQIDSVAEGKEGTHYTIYTPANWLI